MAIQTQTAPGVNPQAEPSAASAVGEPAAAGELTIAEMSRVMDVAAVMRRERSIAAQQLDLTTTKRLLRERLRQAARVAGDPVTDAEIDAAIDQYFDNLHEFSPPKPGVETVLAHLYVARGTIVRWVVGLSALGVLGWALLG